MDKKVKQERQTSEGNDSSQRSETSKGDHVVYDEELGEENVELVDSEWADFERALRYNYEDHQCFVLVQLSDKYWHKYAGPIEFV